MKKIIAVLFLLCIFHQFFLKVSIAQQIPDKTFIPTPIINIEYSLPFPGILPDHPLYPLKTLRDKILLVTTRDQIKKLHLYLLFSDKHLSMSQSLWDKGNIPLSIKTLNFGENYLLNASVLLVKLKQNSFLPVGLADKLYLACDKHEQVIKDLTLLTDSEMEKKQLNELLSVNHQAKQQVLTVK